jgi:hypothetical protein
LKITGETVEKVPKQILGGDAEKNDFTECATINDLTIMKGRETPKNQGLTILKGFSTVSVANMDFTYLWLLRVFLCLDYCLFIRFRHEPLPMIKWSVTFATLRMPFLNRSWLRITVCLNCHLSLPPFGV